MRRSPRPIGSVLRRAVASVAPKTLLAAVQTAWPEVAGEAIAAEATPVSERDGVVTVACRSASWAEQLDLLQTDLLERLNGALGPDRQAAGLRFVIGD